jgi:tetratricopeptide (TPR) repeat protein
MSRPTPSLLPLLLIVAVPLLLLAGCSAKKSGPTTSGDVAGTVADQPPVEASDLPEIDALYDRRDERASTEEAIRLYEEALAADPERADAKAVRVRLSILYYGLAYYFDRAESKKHKMAIYWKGKQVAWDAMMMSPDFAAGIEAGEKIQDAVKKTDATWVDAAYWCALNWARWGEQKGILRVALDIPKVKGVNEHILEIAEDYYKAAVHRFFGAFWVEIPPFAGQDVPRSKAHFERAIELAPEWTENQVNYAGYYATHVRDRELFERLLNEVIEAPIPEGPPYRFEYLVARVDAEELLAQIDDLFDE